jgi:hypothetical protein
VQISEKEKDMEVHPWLPPFTTVGQIGFLEATDSGSKYVEVTKEPYAPLHSYNNASAGPFISSMACACGSKTVDNVCTAGRAMPAGPFWPPTSRMRFQSEPFELIPARR